MLSAAAASFVAGIAAVAALSAHHADFAHTKSSHPDDDATTSNSAAFLVQSDYCRAVYSCSGVVRLNGNSTITPLPPRRRSKCDEILCSCRDHCHLFDACCHDHGRRGVTSVTAVSSLPTTPVRQESSDEWKSSRRRHVPERLYDCHAARLRDNKDLDTCGNPMSGVFVVTGCPATASDTLKSLCEHEPNETESGFNFTLTTDSVTGVTYNNVHCAKCWNVSTASLVTWMWNVYCEEPWVFRPEKTTKVNGTQFTKSIQEIAHAATFLRTKCSLGYEPPPTIVDMLYRCPQDLVDRCPLDTSEREAAACAEGAAATAFFDGGAYRNVDCVHCSDDVSDSLAEASCQALAGENSRGVLPQPEVLSPASQSFSVLLSPASDECPLASTPFEGVLDAAAAISSSKLKQRQLCDLLVRCLFISVGSRDGAAYVDPPCSIFCPGGEFVRGAGCRVRNSTRMCQYTTEAEDAARFAAPSGTALSAKASFVDNTLVIPVNDAIAVCFSCLSVLEYEHFENLDNGTLIAWDGGNGGREDNRSSVHPPLTYVIDGVVARACILPLPANGSELWKDGGGGAGGCVQLPDRVSTALIVVSEVSIVIFVALYVAIPALRRSPGYMVVSEATAFFFGFLLFLLRPAVAASRSFVLCAATAAGAHYFLAAAFVWMALYASEIVRALLLRPSGSRMGTASLSSGFRLDGCCSSSDGPRCLPRAVIYRLVGWGAPLALVAAGLSADALDSDWRPSYGPPHCFIRSRLGNRILFVGPLCACVSLCVAIYTFMVVKLASVVRQTVIARRHGGTSGGIANSEKLALVAKLALALGLLWTFAALAAFVESAELECTFVVLNSLQGAFLLAAHGSGREVRRRRWGGKCVLHCLPSRPSLSQCDSRGSSNSDGKRLASITASTKTSSLA